MRKALLYILIVLGIGLAIRLFPTLISGMPFSTDAWPLIRNTELLSVNTPVPLNSAIFEGYNNFWPASQVFGAVLSEVFALPVITVMALGIPVVAGLTIPIFYFLVKRITGSSVVSLIAAALLSTVFPYALFTAGVTKETFASPIYISLILIFLLKHNWKTTLLFSVLSVTLVLTHHLTSFLALGIIASLTIASFIAKKDKDESAVNSGRSNLLFLIVFGGVVGLYFLFFASPSFMQSISAGSLVSVAAYQLLLTSLVVYLAYSAKRSSLKRIIVNSVLGFLGIFAIIFLITQVSLFPGAPTLPVSYFLYAFPFIVGLPLCIFGLSGLYQRKTRLLIPLFWVVGIVSFMVYAVFANASGGISLAYRSLNFLVVPLIILVAIGIFAVVSKSRGVASRRITTVLAVAIIVSIMTVGAYSVYATVSLQEPYLGYFWRYEPSEFYASNWLSTNLTNQTVAGDSKVSYLVNGYFDKNVSVTSGIRYLEEDGSPPQLLYIYSQMYQNGYVLFGGSPVPLPDNWTAKLADYNCIFANNEVSIYARQK